MSKPIDTRTDIAKENEKKAHRDPVTGEPGMHPVGTGLGAAAGGAAAAAGVVAAGTAMGATAGPIGMVIGGIAGAIIGADAGKAIGEDINPTQLVWWEENYTTRPYVKPGRDFSVYEPAYRSGIEAARTSKGQDFADLAPSIQNNWNLSRGNSQLEWDDARPAVEDAFQSYVSYRPGADAR